MGKASRKVEDGKLVKIKLDLDDDIVTEARIRGDFFLEPPEKLEALENAIEGVAVDSTVDELVTELDSVEADLIGFARKDIAEAFKKAVEGEIE